MRTSVRLLALAATASFAAADSHDRCLELVLRFKDTQSENRWCNMHNRDASSCLGAFATTETEGPVHTKIRCRYTFMTGQCSLSTNPNDRYLCTAPFAGKCASLINDREDLRLRNPPVWCGRVSREGQAACEATYVSVFRGGITFLDTPFSELRECLWNTDTEMCEMSDTPTFCSPVPFCQDVLDRVPAGQTSTCGALILDEAEKTGMPVDVASRQIGEIYDACAACLESAVPTVPESPPPPSPPPSPPPPVPPPPNPSLPPSPPPSPPLPPSPPFRLPACPPEGIFERSTNVYIAFEDSELIINNLGGLGTFGPTQQEFFDNSPFFQMNLETEAFPPQGIYYRVIGEELITRMDGSMVRIPFDMYVVNRSEYVPNNPRRNGLREGIGDFGVINLADNQECDFEYFFIESNSGQPYTITQPFSFFIFDLDEGDGERLVESMTVCGIQTFRRSIDIYPDQGLRTAVDFELLGPSNEPFGGFCYRFTATEFGPGSNNPTFQSDIFAPTAADLSQFAREMMMPYIVEIEFPGGVPGFTFTYKVTAAANVGRSGRNYLYTGRTEQNEATFSPCPPSLPPSPPPSPPPLPPPPSPPPPSPPPPSPPPPSPPPPVPPPPSPPPPSPPPPSPPPPSPPPPTPPPPSPPPPSPPPPSPPPPSPPPPSPPPPTPPPPSPPPPSPPPPSPPPPTPPPPSPPPPSPPPPSPPPSPPPPSFPPGCPPLGFFDGSSSVFLDFDASELEYNNLGGLGPFVNSSFVATNPFLSSLPEAEPQGIYYSNIGTEILTGEDQIVMQIQFDMYVTNTTEYRANFPARNGKRGGFADFGVINLRDDQSCTFDYKFIARDTGQPYVVSNQFGFYLFDFDTGEAARLTERLLVCGLLEGDPFQTSAGLFNVPSTITATETDSRLNCWEFKATLRAGGENNPGFASEVFAPQVLLSNFTTQEVLPCMLLVNFPANSDGFTVTYSISAAANRGQSGRNFLFTGYSINFESAFIPCPPAPPPPPIPPGDGKPSDAPALLLPVSPPSPYVPPAPPGALRILTRFTICDTDLSRNDIVSIQQAFMQDLPPGSMVSVNTFTPFQLVYLGPEQGATLVNTLDKIACGDVLQGTLENPIKDCMVRLGRNANVCPAMTGRRLAARKLKGRLLDNDYDYDDTIRSEIGETADLSIECEHEEGWPMDCPLILDAMMVENPEYFVLMGDSSLVVTQSVPVDETVRVADPCPRMQAEMSMMAMQTKEKVSEMLDYDSANIEFDVECPIL